MFAICAHARVRAALEAEVDERLGGGAPTHDNIDQLVYLSAFVQETMRLVAATCCKQMSSCPFWAVLGRFVLTCQLLVPLARVLA